MIVSATNLFVLIIVFLCVRNTIQKCVSEPFWTECDSLQELYSNTNLSGHVIITLPCHSDYELTVVPSEVANNIKWLEIKGPKLKMEKDAFQNFVNLDTLSFLNTHTEGIPDDIFRNLNLTVLDFYQNGIGSITQKSFLNLPNLEQLRLTNNNLTKIESGMFDNLTVTLLDIAGNQIDNIEEGSLRNIPNLKDLRLGSNHLEQFIAHKHLESPQILEKLSLNYNKITTLSGWVLKDLSSLKLLNLRQNSISTIEAETFEETPRLQSLVLSYNSIETLDRNVFPKNGLRHLRSLYLDHNKLMYLSTNFFSRLPNLKGVSVGGNPWWCPCLDLVVRVAGDFEVQLPCDEEYLSGERPECLPYIDGCSCVYSYNESLSTDFLASNALYPDPVTCIMTIKDFV